MKAGMVILGSWRNWRTSGWIYSCGTSKEIFDIEKNCFNDVEGAGFDVIDLGINNLLKTTLLRTQIYCSPVSPF